MNRKAIISAALSLALYAGMSVSAHAANPNAMRIMEENSRRAVAVAISAGIIPPDATIYDCAYGEGANGATVVVRYKDDNGVWIDVTTGKAVEQEAPPAPSAPPIAEDTLAEYANEVFRLVNDARAEAGLDPLERSEYLEDAAQIRAEECASMNSIRYNGQAHTRPDGSRWWTVFGITKNYNYGENAGQGKSTAEKQMESWMASDGHRASILRDDYNKIGIGVAVSEQGKVYAVQIFSRP